MSSISFPFKGSLLILNLSTKTITEKINVAATLINEIYENNDILFVVDNLAIVSKDGNLVDWYHPLIDWSQYVSSSYAL